MEVWFKKLSHQWLEYSLSVYIDFLLVYVMYLKYVVETNNDKCSCHNKFDYIWSQILDFVGSNMDRTCFCFEFFLLDLLYQKVHNKNIFNILFSNCKNMLFNKIYNFAENSPFGSVQFCFSVSHHNRIVVESRSHVWNVEKEMYLLWQTHSPLARGIYRYQPRD